MPDDGTNRRIEELIGENARRKAVARDAVAKLRLAEARVAELESAAVKAAELVSGAESRIKTLEASVATAEKAAADAPSAHRDEVDRLRAELLGRDRRAAFDRVAATRIRPDAMADAFERVRWSDDGVIDESSLGAEIDRLLADRPYFEKPPSGGESDAGGSGESARVSRPPGPGSDRGSAVPTVAPQPRHDGRIA